MALTVYDRGGSGYANVNITTIHPGVNFSAAGTMAVVIFAYDNSGTSGADPFVSISDSLGNTYTPILNVLRDPGAANAGVVLRAFYTYQDGGALTTSTNVTFDLSASAVGCVQWYEITGNVGTVVTFGTGSGGSSTGFTSTTGSVSTDDVLINMVGIEYGASFGMDTDATNGDYYNADQTRGSGATGVSLSAQYKNITGNGTQSYGIGWGGSTIDYCRAWVQIDEIPLPATSFDPFGALGIFGI